MKASQSTAQAYVCDPGPRHRPLSGTVKISASSADLFPDSFTFKASVENFRGSYDINTQALGLSADSLTLDFGKVFEVKGSDLSLGIVASQSPPSVTFDAGQIDLSSPDFPGAQGTLKKLHVDDSGFSLDEGFVTAPTIKLGSAVEIDGLTVDAKNLSYSPSASPALTGAVGISVSDVKLFPDSSVFASHVTDFSATYDIQTQAVSLSLGHADLALSDLLDITLDGATFTDDAGNVEIKIDSASATIPRLAGLTGTVMGLDITNDSFTVDSAKLQTTGDVSLGIFDFTGLYAEATSFGYSATGGGSFNGFLKVGADKADLSPEERP